MAALRLFSSLPQQLRRSLWPTAVEDEGVEGVKREAGGDSEASRDSLSARIRRFASMCRRWSEDGEDLSPAELIGVSMWKANRGEGIFAYKMIDGQKRRFETVNPRQQQHQHQTNWSELS